MQKSLASIAVVILLGFVPSSDATVTHDTKYAALQPVAVTSVWCAAGGHPYTPQGDPRDHDDTVSYLASGEPECLAGDVVFGTDQDHGINGASYDVDDDAIGSWFTVTVTDDRFDTTNVFVWAVTTGGETVADEACGSTSILIRDDLRQHWSSTRDEPLFLVQALIDGTFLDPDLLEVCLGSTGRATASYGF